MSDAPITAKFQAKAPKIMRAIIRDLQAFEVDEEDAAAILGSFGVETGGFELRQETGKPNKDSTGYGWAQWTGMDAGERRLLFEQWCNANGFKDVVNEPDDSPEDRYDKACHGYFIHEISKTWEKRVLTDGGTISGTFYPALGDCSTLEQKTVSFFKLFERPGTPHEDWRHEMAQEALRLYRGAPPLEETSMRYGSVVISSGHGKYVRGASGVLDEVDEARKIVDEVATLLQHRGVNVETFHDNTSKTQDENLHTIVNFHNAQDRDLDISVHLNAFEQTDEPMGTEVLYYSQADLANELSAAIAVGRFINRGGKKNTGLFFLNGTEMPSVLLEVCFVDSSADAEVYKREFDAICEAIVTVISGIDEEDIEVVAPPSTYVRRVDIQVSGDVKITLNGKPVE